MKKLLLLLLTLLAFAPPGAKAELTEMVLFDKMNMPENAEYNLFSNDNTWNKITSIGTTAMKEVKSIRIPVPEYDDYIILEFDKTSYSGTSYSTQIYTSVLWISHGVKFKIYMQSDIGTISNITINSHVWGTAADNAQYPIYATKSYNRLKHTGCGTTTCNSNLYIHQIKLSDPARIADGFYVEKLSGETTGVASIDKIELEVTPKPYATPSTPAIICTNADIKESTVKFINAENLNFTFQKGDTNDPDDIKIFGKFVPSGSDETSVSYTEYSLESSITIPAQNGDFYYYSTNPLSVAAKSEIASIKIKSALVTSKIFDYDAQVDGKLRVFVNGNMEGEEYRIGYTYTNVNKLVYIPNPESDVKDAVIVTVDGTLNINSRWLSITPETRFTITTQNGGTLYKETFDCTASGSDNWSGARCDYINYDNTYQNTMSYWEGGKKQTKRILI